jgi:hypothetical protein
MLSKNVPQSFAFFRRSDIERETNLLLAGDLIVDLPKDSHDPEGEWKIGETMRKLRDRAMAGKMSSDAVIYGWWGGRPANAFDPF